MHTTDKRQKHSCDTCQFRKKAEQSPRSFLGRLWIWHTGFCPGWKRYLKTLHDHGVQRPEVGSLRGVWRD